MSVNRNPADWTSEPVTSAKMQAEVHDLSAGLQAPGDVYPVVLSNWTVGNGTLIGRTYRVGRRVDVEIDFTAGSGTSFTSVPVFSLPTPPRLIVPQLPLAGQVWLWDDSAGASLYYVPALTASGGSVQARSTAGTAVGPTAPFTWAPNDRIYITCSYESAT